MSYSQPAAEEGAAVAVLGRGQLQADGLIRRRGRPGVRRFVCPVAVLVYRGRGVSCFLGRSVGACGSARKPLAALGLSARGRPCGCVSPAFQRRSSAS